VFRFIFVLLASLVTWNAQAQTASASLSETSAQLKYGLLVGGASYGRSEMVMGLLFNEKDDYVAELGLHVVDEAGSRARGLKIGVGGKVFATTMPASSRDVDLLALGLGMQMMYSLPGADRISVGGTFYYAPPIVSFMDAERFREGALRLQFALFPEAAVYVEAHQFHVTLSDGRGSFSIEKGARVGLQVEF